MIYDAREFIHAEPREYAQDPDNCSTCTDRFGDVCCTVVWTPRSGDAVTVTGLYLDGCRSTGEIVLSCGIEEMLSDLDLWGVIADDDSKRWVVCDLVNLQLERRPWAEVICPEGRARLELLPC